MMAFLKSEPRSQIVHIEMKHLCVENAIRARSHENMIYFDLLI